MASSAPLRLVAAVSALAAAATGAFHSREAALALKAAVEAAAGSNATKAAPCSWAPPSDCASTFTYEGQTYSGCCTAGSADAQGWCSHTETYSGGWSGCSWTCEEVSGDGTVVMPFANDWLPSVDEVSFMKAEADRAEAIRLDTLRSQEELRKAFADAEEAYQAQAKVAAEAQQKAAIADSLAQKELQRQNALPSLAKMAQKQAIEEHEARIAAEKRLVEARKKRVEADETQGESLLKIRQAITKQRLVNRVRAAEDARIADAALHAAQQARYEIEQKKKITDAVNAAVEQALAQRKDATLLTGQILVNATAGLTAKVSQATANAAAQDSAARLAQANLEVLRAKAEKSKADALEAQAQAYEDRSRADAATMGSAALAKAKDCEDAKLAAASAATEEAKDTAASSASAAKTAVTDKKLAEDAAFSAQGEALENLKVAADAVGKVSGDTQYAANIAEVAPESFITGFSKSVVA